MLSRKEIEYLSEKIYPNKNYEYKIIHSIRKKLKTFCNLELPLIESRTEALCGVAAELGKLTSYRARLTPLISNSLIMIKYLD